MRRALIIGLALLTSSAASAACRCACVEGVSRALCASTVDVEPICQQICPSKLTAQDISPGSIRLPGSETASRGGSGAGGGPLLGQDVESLGYLCPVGPTGYPSQACIANVPGFDISQDPTAPTGARSSSPW